MSDTELWLAAIQILLDWGEQAIPFATQCVLDSLDGKLEGDVNDWLDVTRCLLALCVSPRNAN